MSSLTWQVILSLVEDESTRCLHLLQGIIFTYLICSPSKCDIFFGITSAVKDEYSRAMLGKQSGRGSRQSVPDQKIDTKCWLIALFLLISQVKTKTRKMTGRKHDMRYFCFQPS
ncbi:hypothetical protein ACFX2I_025337 [Malus domestica]